MSKFEVNKIFDCKGLVAVITGGGSGLGSYTAKALDANGAEAVYIIGRRKESLEKVVKECPNGSVRAIVGDVTSKQSLAAAAAQIEKEVGYVNLVFANSGISGQEAASKLPSDYSLKDFKDVMFNAPMEKFTEALNVNVTGVWYTAMAFLELLDAGNKKGNVYQKSQIVTTASVAGLSRFLATGIDYSTSKAAVIHMTKMMATTFGKFMIRANCIAPGFFLSEMTENSPIMKKGDPTKEGAFPTSFAPLGRIGSEEDWAATVLYLMSSAGAFLDGVILTPDGGRLSILPSSY